MQVRCPHCHVPFESVDHASWANMLCPACGSSFSLTGVDATCAYRPGVQVLGHFELLQEVGAGRFGSVWKARDTQLQRIVAIKIPRQRDLDPKETDVFLRDARAAAQLNHPRIAGVHEVGRENNTVFIVTDFIDGANLSEWLTGQKLTSRESAELVVKIAEALHHAHEAGVVHRDLKPSNIMLDRDGEPHVIDFGLARRETGEIAMTVEGQVLGTPAYMSPEQARGEGHQADRRSDVYSLGVILFELLTGELPFRGDARMLIVQILDEEPPSPRKLKGTVSRDLETITLRCLQKEPVKRYQTAQELADDLKRFLKGEPIKARPIGRAQTAWRWCRRKPAIAGMAAAVFAILTVGIVTSSYFAASASREAQQALASRKTAEGVNKFFTEEVFGLADPNNYDRAGITLVDALDVAAGKIDQTFPDDVALRAEIRQRIGEIYSSIDKPPHAIDQLRQAVELRRSIAGNLDPATMKCRAALGLALYQASHWKESREVLESAWQDQSHVFGEGSPEATETASNLALVCMEARGGSWAWRALPPQDDRDLEVSRTAYDAALARLGPRHVATLKIENLLGWVLRWRAKSDEGIRYAKEAADGLRNVKGSDDLGALLARYNYAACLVDLKRYDEAAVIFREILDVRNRVLGPTHYDTICTAWQLVSALTRGGKTADALQVIEDTHSKLSEIKRLKTPLRAQKMLDFAGNCRAIDQPGMAGDFLLAADEIASAVPDDENQHHMYAKLLNDIAMKMIQIPESTARNLPRAIELATKACELTSFKNRAFVQTLVAAYEMAGDKQAAAKARATLETLQAEPPAAQNETYR